MEYRECACEHCERNTNNFNGRFKKYNDSWYCNKHYDQLKRNGYITDFKVNSCNGVNDMDFGFMSDETNKRIYRCWYNMLQRCYSGKQKAYDECYVCNKWLKLSGFVEDISKIDNYELWLNNTNKDIALDKDIKSNGKNKCYCLEECMFATNKDNAIQSHKTRNQNGSNNPYAVKIVQLSKQNNFIKEWNTIREASENLNIDYSGISGTCRGKIKSSGGFIWMYKDTYELYKKLNDYLEIDKKLEYITNK